MVVVVVVVAEEGGKGGEGAADGEKPGGINASWPLPAFAGCVCGASSKAIPAAWS